MSRVEELCRGKLCLVLGSAPTLDLNKWEGLEGACVVAANGAGGLVYKHGGICTPRLDVLVTTSWLFRSGSTASEKATVEQLSGVRARRVWVYDAQSAIRQAIKTMKLVSVFYERLEVVDERERNEVTTAALGCHSRVSSGVWAACLAVVSGASQVIVDGIGFDNGHKGVVNDLGVRDHVEEDKVALNKLTGLGVEVWAQ